MEEFIEPLGKLLNFSNKIKGFLFLLSIIFYTFGFYGSYTIDVYILKVCCT